MSDNGWSNYATRTVGAWLDNDSDTYDTWQARAKELLEEQEFDKDKAADELGEELEKHFEEELDGYNLEGPIHDFAHNELASVNWIEIAEHQLEDLEVWVAMWNMPGCLPEMAPMRFGDFEDARQAIVDELESLDEEDLDNDNGQLKAAIVSVESAQDGFTVAFGQYAYSVTQDD